MRKRLQAKKKINIKEGRMARLPLIDPEATSGDVRASFDRMPVKLNIFRMITQTELSSRAALCRQLAQREPNSKVYWLAEAER